MGLTTFATAILFVLVAVLVGALPFLLGRRLLRLSKGADSVDLAKEVLKQVGAIHGLILALVFADVLGHYGALRENIAGEASLLGAIYYDLRRYDDAQAEAVRPLLVRYATCVVDQEWQSLRHDRLSAECWYRYDDLFSALLALPATSAGKRLLLRELVGQLEEVERYRHQRLFEAQYHKPALFWIIAVVGFLVSCGLIGIFRPQRLNLLIAAGYSMLTGLVFFFIFAVTDPFDELVRLPPEPFETFLAEIGRRAAVQSP